MYVFTSFHLKSFFQPHVSSIHFSKCHQSILCSANVEIFKDTASGLYLAPSDCANIYNVLFLTYPRSAEAGNVYVAFLDYEQWVEGVLKRKQKNRPGVTKGRRAAIVWPSISIVWPSTICFYCVAQNHMLVGVSLSAICFYCVGQNRLFLL